MTIIELLTNPVAVLGLAALALLVVCIVRPNSQLTSLLSRVVGGLLAIATQRASSKTIDAVPPAEDETTPGGPAAPGN
jgi:hypothetical protein